MAQFRVRQLQGRTLALPDGYDGVLLADTLSASISDGEERRWLKKRRFSELVYWKHDDVPLNSDPLSNCMKWARMASVLHADHTPVHSDHDGAI